MRGEHAKITPKAPADRPSPGIRTQTLIHKVQCASSEQNNAVNSAVMMRSQIRCCWVAAVGPLERGPSS